MARRRVSIEEKIEHQKQVVSKYKARYEAELKKLDGMMAIRDAELDKELLSAFHKNSLSHQDVIRLLSKSRTEDRYHRMVMIHKTGMEDAVTGTALTGYNRGFR